MTIDALALVLAAGRGTRVGGPKALLLVDDVPLAVLHLRARAADCARAVLVTRKHIVDALAPLVAELANVSFVVSEEPDEDGPAGSLRAAMQAGVCRDSHAHVVVGPVDARPVRSTTIDTLLAPLRFTPRDRPISATRFSRGHPVAMRTSVLKKAYLRAGSSPPPLRTVLQALGDGLVTLPDCGDPAVTDELDEIADVLRVTGAPPRFRAFRDLK